MIYLAHSYTLGAGACLGIGGLMGLYEFTGAWKGLLKYKTEVCLFFFENFILG